MTEDITNTTKTVSEIPKLVSVCLNTRVSQWQIRPQGSAGRDCRGDTRCHVHSSVRLFGRTFSFDDPSINKVLLRVLPLDFGLESANQRRRYNFFSRLTMYQNYYF